MLTLTKAVFRTKARTDGDGRGTGPPVEEVQVASAGFARLYTRHVERIYRYVRSRVTSDADAEDITAEVFAAAFAGLARYRQQGCFAAWLYGIARRSIAKYYEREARDARDTAVPPAESGDDLLARVARTERQRMLMAKVARLSEDERDLLHLRFAAELTYREMGDLTGRTEAAVKMAVHRLLDRLAQDLEDAHVQDS
jgi:RNA polymerase sigma factor (sigma-70 family)